MGNMSYVRFENTYRDLQDCYLHMDEVEDLSSLEVKYRLWLIKLCVDIANEYAEELED